MTYNQNNTKYISALKGLPFGTRQTGKAAVEFHRGRGRPMGSHRFHLRPILRDPPDMERLGRAILELAEQGGDQNGDGK